MWASVLLSALVCCFCSELYGFSLSQGSYQDAQQSYYEVFTHCEREGGECIDVDFNAQSQAESIDSPPTVPPPTIPPTPRAPPPPTHPLSNILPVFDPFVPFVPNNQPPTQQPKGTPPVPPMPQFIPRFEPQIFPNNIPNMLPQKVPKSVPRPAPRKTPQSKPMSMPQSPTSDPFLLNKQPFFPLPKQTTSAPTLHPEIPGFARQMIPAIPQAASKYIPNFIKPVVQKFLRRTPPNSIKTTSVPPQTVPMNRQARVAPIFVPHTAPKPAMPKFAPPGASQNTQPFPSNLNPPKQVAQNSFPKYVPPATFIKANGKVPKFVPPPIPPVAKQMMYKYAPAAAALRSKPVPPNSPVVMLPTAPRMVPKASPPVVPQAGRQTLPQAVLPLGPTYEPLTRNKIVPGKGNRLVLPAGQQPVPQTPNMLYFPRPAPRLTSTDAPVTTTVPKLMKKKKTRKGKKARRVVDVEKELPESRQRRAVGQEDPLTHLSRECPGGLELDLGCGSRKGNVCCYPASARRRK